MSDTDDSEPSTSFSTRKNKAISVSSDDEDILPQATGCHKNGEKDEEESSDGEKDEEKGRDEDEEEEGRGSPVIDKDEEEEEDVMEGDDGCDTGDSDSSSGPPGAETCAICLGRIRGEVGTPEVCDHIFCLFCILEWARTNATCPQDRKPFEVVSVQECFGGEVVRRVPIKKEEKEDVVIPEEENPTYCEVCHECNHEERLLLCDGCDLGYHLECLDPPLAQVPVEEWFCPVCAASPQVPSDLEETTTTRQPRITRRTETRSTDSQVPQRQQRAPRRIPRTRATERVRARIQHHRRQVRAAKRKRRKQRKRERIDNGEEEDIRPPVKRMSRFSLFVSGDDDIDAEHTEDKYATQVLSGECPREPIYRDPATRRADAARILHLNTFTPLPGYSGRAPATIIDRVDSQRSQSEGDVLDSILHRQSIALTSSKNLTLTSDGKLASQGELDGDLPDTFGKQNLIMSEPLPSQRSPGREKNEEGKQTEKDKRNDSKRDGESERRRDGNEDCNRKRDKDRDGDDRKQRDWEEDRRRERDGEEFRRRWRDGDDERDKWKGYNVKRGDRGNYSTRRDYHREDGKYGSRHTPHRSHQSSRYLSHYEPYRNRENSFQQSPLEDKRRSPPRLSYHKPQGQYSHRRERYPNSPPSRRNFDSYKDHRKDDRSSFKNRDNDIGHRSFCRSNAGDQRELGSTRNDGDYRRSNDSSRRYDSDFRRSDSSSRRSDSDFSRSDGEEPLGGRRRHSPTRKPEVDVTRHSRLSDERGHRTTHQTTHHSKSRSQASRSRSRSNSRSPDSHHRSSDRRTESKGYSQLDSNRGRSKCDSHIKPREATCEDEYCSKDVGGSAHQRENLHYGKESKHEHRKDLLDSKYIEETEIHTDKALERDTKLQGRLKTDFECSNEDEVHFTSTNDGSIDETLDDQISNEMYIEETNNVSVRANKSHKGINKEDERISHSHSYNPERKHHEHGHKKEGRERERKEKKATGSSKHHQTNLFGDDSDNDNKSHTLQYNMLFDKDREELKDTPRKIEIPKAKSGDKNKKKSQRLKELFSDDDHDEQERHTQKNETEVKSIIDRESKISSPLLTDDYPVNYIEFNLRKEKLNSSSHKLLLMDEDRDRIISSQDMDKPEDPTSSHNSDSHMDKDTPTSSHTGRHKDTYYNDRYKDTKLTAHYIDKQKDKNISHHNDRHKDNETSHYTNKHKDKDTVSLHHTDIHKDKHHTDIHKDKHHTDIHKDKHHTDIHKDKHHTDIHKDKHHTDVHKDKHHTDIHKDKHHTDIHKDKHHTDIHKDKDTSLHTTDQHIDIDTSSYHTEVYKDKDSVASCYTDKSKSKRKDNSHSAGRKSCEKDITSKEPKSKEKSKVSKSDDKSKGTSLDTEDDLSSVYSHSSYNKDNDWFQHTLDIIKKFRDSKKKQETVSKPSVSPKPESQDEAGSSHHQNINEDSPFVSDNNSKCNKDSSSKTPKVKTGQKVIMDLFGDIEDMENSINMDMKTEATERYKKAELKSKIDKKDKTLEKDDNCSMNETAHTENGRDINILSSTTDQEKTQNSSSSSSSSSSMQSIKAKPQEKTDKKAIDKIVSGSSKGGVKETCGSQHLKPAQKATLEAKVVSEVKHWLDPHYKEKSITKSEYKEIVAKCVTKVVSAECGDIIESEKMRCLVDGYIKVYKHRRTKHQMQLLSPH
ncbi:hypothetical protein Pcinc_022016 [Petrolisthes cinctipes]|uniref:PHD and RING finger domain-containing protein 1 n=1 Tax=Petrolisthes cinctipes TaxID=88211 RepID=A0AAE1KEA0_PETCI|nr:hypothetical protein Pcinc_022016 [Petrolisthes cinctipes]